jgi:uncharacterized protein (TIGR02145 family)
MEEYYPETQFCYNGEIIDKCGGEEYDPEEFFCSSREVSAACCNNGVCQSCYVNSIYLERKCAGEAYDLANHLCLLNLPNGDLLANRCGTYIYNPASQRCANDAVETKCGNDWYDYSKQFCLGGTTSKNYGFITDSYSGKIYKTIVIGTQTWMAENLNHSFGECYFGGDDCEGGRLYSWEWAMDACPEGWHLPGDAEWTTLVNYVGSEETAGNKLEAHVNYGFDFRGTGIGGTNDYGFSGALRGPSNPDGSYGWWSSTEHDANNANYIHINGSSTILSYIDKSNLYSVRCVQD